MTPSQLARNLARLNPDIDTVGQSLTSSSAPPVKLDDLRLDIEKAFLTWPGDSFFGVVFSQWCKVHRYALRCASLKRLDEMDDDIVYSVYLFIASCPFVDKANLHLTQIGSAILHLDHLNRSDDRLRDLFFADGTWTHTFPRVVPQNLPDHAILADNVAECCLAMTLSGKRLSRSLVLHLVSRHAAGILAHLVRHDKTVFRAFSPEKLLLIAISTLNSPRVPEVVAAIEETAPGAIAAAGDANGFNALVHAARFHPGNPRGWSDQEVFSALTSYLLAHGADPDQRPRSGFSYRTLSRLLDIIARHAPPRHLNPSTCNLSLP